MHGRFKKTGDLITLFQSRPRSILGIDITPTAVKIIELSKQDDSLCVEHYGLEPVPPHAFDGNAIIDIDAVAACIKKVISRVHTQCKQVVLAVPDAAIISKVIQLNDGLNDTDMEELIVMEADKYIPYPVDEINLDFEILGQAENNPAMLDVLIVASRAENVTNRVEAVQRAGLNAFVVDVVSYAVERAAQKLAQDLPAAGQGKTLAIIDMGAHYTHLFVLHDMKLRYTRDEQFGAMQLLESIAAHYQITIEQAALAKDRNQLPSDYETRVLEPFKEHILLQIKRTMHFFHSVSQEERVDHVLLAGGLACLPGLTQLIQEQLGVSSTVANPFAYMALGKRVSLTSINNDGPSFMVACGLALRGIE